jgi:hypothetical protein
MNDLEVPPIVRTAFDSGRAGAEPPLRLTSAGLVEAGRRARRRRQLVRGGGIGAATVAAVVAVAALPAMGVVRSGTTGGAADVPAAGPTTGGTHPPTGGTRPPTAPRKADHPPGRPVGPPPGAASRPGARPTGPPSRSPRVPPQPPASTEPRAVAAARITDALHTTLHLPAGLTVRPAEDSGLPALVARPSQGGFKAMADLASPAGTGGILVSVAGVAPGPVHCPRPDRNSSCRMQDGVAITISRQSLRGTVTWSVWATRPDHSSVGVIASNAQLAALDGGRARLPEPPLSIAQMTAITLAPGMSYYPPR